MLVPVKTLRLLTPVCALFFLTSCGSSDSTPPQPTTDSGKDTGTITDGGDGGDTAVAPCSEPVEDRPAGSVCVRRVKGSVTDAAGKVIPQTLGSDGKMHGLTISVCGSICYYGETGADGTFDTEVGHYLTVDKFATLIHGRPDYASLYVAIPKPDASDVITLVDKLKIPQLPATGPVLVKDDGTGSLTLPASSPITSGDITLTFPAGTVIERDIEDVTFDTDADKGKQDKGKTFRVAVGSMADPPPFAKGSKVVGLWVISPFDAKFTDGKTPAKAMKVGVSVKNPDVTKLPAGSKVEFIAMGDELINTPFTGGALQVVAKGTVSSDGTKIDTDSGEGITYMTWLGVQPAP